MDKLEDILIEFDPNDICPQTLNVNYGQRGCNHDRLRNIEKISARSFFIET